jgi:hypothetical protein
MTTQSPTVKALKFSPSLVPLILSGQKTTTWRLWDDKQLQPGDIVTFIRRPQLQPFVQAQIVSVTEKPFGQLDKDDKQGHEPFSSDQEMYTTFSNYYRQPVTPTTLVKVVKFKLIPERR